MSKVTSKLQVTVPKAIAEGLGIRPGDEIDWLPAEGSARIVPVKKAPAAAQTLKQRLRLFDLATARQAQRQKGRVVAETTERGWRREELYDRGRTR